MGLLLLFTDNFAIMNSVLSFYFAMVSLVCILDLIFGLVFFIFAVSESTHSQSVMEDYRLRLTIYI